jgi:para-nitrobenzyl esterase
VEGGRGACPVPFAQRRDLPGQRGCPRVVRGGRRRPSSHTAIASKVTPRPNEKRSIECDNWGRGCTRVVFGIDIGAWVARNCGNDTRIKSALNVMALRAYSALALGLAATACSSAQDTSPSRDAGSDAASHDARDSGAAPLLVAVAGGTLEGIADGASVSFRGIPYAASPVGALRWARPGPAPTWTGARDASLVGNYCLQYDESNGIAVGDEDCLFLNVWTPSERTSSPLPVIFFIHGGDWISGTGSFAGYDGSSLAAAGPAVVVTINYRLGPLGFLPLPALAAEDPNGSTGNYGLLDQQAALQWVKQNIAAFGGDPTHVTLWGQSAGAWSTLMHLASPLGRGLFASAVSESGGVGLRDLATSESLVGAPYVAQLGCADDAGAADGGAALVACLRAVPESSVLWPAPSDDSWGPVIDGYVITEPLMTTFNAGKQAHVPLILGTTSLEYGSAGLPVVPPGPPVASVTTLAEYENAVTLLFGESNATSILAMYPTSSYASPQAAYIAVLDDWGMFCPMRRVARAFVASQSEPVWRYLFSHVDSNGVQASTGPVHASDLPFWFATFPAFDFTPDSTEASLSSSMGGYLTRFAATGNPNGDGATKWPTYASTDPYLDFADTPTADAGLDTSACDFWDNLH